jgi:hypothetical protein
MDITGTFQMPMNKCTLSVKTCTDLQDNQKYTNKNQAKV